MNDYEIDKKLGDVGSKVREASIKSLTTILVKLYKNKNSNFLEIFNKFIISYFNGLLKQLAEKMNRIRLIAGDSLQKFFYELKDYDLPGFEELKMIFLDDIKFNDQNQINNVSWLEPKYSYKKIIHLILYENYSFNLFAGLITSIGGITEDVQRYSLEGLDDLFLQISSDKEIRDKFIMTVYNHIINIFILHEKEDRVIEPLYNTLGHLLTKNQFINNDYLDKIINLL